MKKVALLAIASLVMAGCSSSSDVEVTLTKGETTVQEVENLLGSPQSQATMGNKLIYDYTSSHVGRDVTTGLLLGWQFLDNHVLTLCDKGKKNCQVFKAKEDEDAKSLRINFENGVVTDAKILDL
ncbi:hypothetical protein SAMN02910357_00320 [Succinivibrio dextrinosolvens]|uniref:hypothetical protein n=1 Tax=Succinivibrio dextrinosolvens TaxID=83771 RepID=UPI0008E9A285|nr:hypothetical protein [Succinivibrio dextrinosolvens]SFS36122.1 hypothetical protein SAMN02910357_00320 [Succinivibrio dextrinosolvens]